MVENMNTAIGEIREMAERVRKFEGTRYQQHIKKEKVPNIRPTSSMLHSH